MSKVPTPDDIAHWPEPNYVNPDTRRPLILGVEIPLMVLVISFVSMRFYSRTVLIHALGWDDWMMLAAAICAVSTSVMTCISTDVHTQTGYHLWDLRPDILMNPVRPAKMAMATQLLFVPITAFTKLSILLTYLRIFPSKSNKIFCYCMMAFTAVWSIASFLVALLQCTPIEAYWEQSKYPNRKCISIAAIYYTTGCLNVTSDFLIFLWPARDLAKVRISFKQRVMLITMFSLGVIICAAGVIRIYYTSVFIQSYDVLWHGATLYVIVAVETSIGIVCGSLPACKPIMSKIAPRIFNSTHSETYRSTHKKASKVGGQSFPFESLSGGIIKEEGYSVEYADATVRHSARGHVPTTKVTISRPQKEEDAISAESQEWIMMQDRSAPGGIGGQGPKSEV